MNVDFEYELDDVVTVKATSEKGVVTMCGIDDGGKKYFVQGSGEGKWWAERMLTSE